MRKRIYGTPTEADKARAAKRIMAYYKRKNRERWARAWRQEEIAKRKRRAANRRERLTRGVVLIG